MSSSLFWYKSTWGHNVHHTIIILMQPRDARRLPNLLWLLIVQSNHLRRMVQFVTSNRTQRVINYVEHVGILFHCTALVGLVVFEGLETTVLAALLLASIKLMLLGLHLCENELLLFLNLPGNHSNIKETISVAHPGILDTRRGLEGLPLLIGRFGFLCGCSPMNEILKGLVLALIR